ncbi:hypothetical protein [Enterococcus sp.]|uniref:hypothetical protein n=1 Tax=Enterococcus sp. TaxID=35783 RepID=UPI0028A94B55|nr:hypothetical protein [Enterococcus sp.]
MFFLTKKGLHRLAAPYITDGAAIAYGTWQSFNAPSSRCLCVLNDQQLHILSLNLFSTKVLYAQVIPLSDMKKVKLQRHLSTATWHFAYANQGYRFQFPLTILTLGQWQPRFLSRCEQLFV